MAGPGGGHGSDEDVDRFWKHRGDSTVDLGVGQVLGGEEAGLGAPPLQAWLLPSPNLGSPAFCWPHLSRDSCSG